MPSVLTAAQSRALDRAAIEGLGLPGIALMETASRGLAEAVRVRLRAPGGGLVVVACGGGNNGGDGYGCARWLHSWGVEVAVWSLSARSSGDAQIMRQACEVLGLRAVDGPQGATIIVDAIFGTGLDRPVTGALRAAIERINEAAAPVISADLPSGLHADTGAVLGVAVRARATVTFGAYKAGLFTGSGLAQAGELTLVELGIAPAIEAVGRIPGPAELAAAWPRRGSADHKTRSGHLLVVAGSTSMAGAAILCCRGAFAAGVGLVTLLAPRGAMPRLEHLPPEVMVTVRGAGDVLDAPLPEDLERRSAVVIGPGLGAGAPLPPALAAWISHAWTHESRPICADADALPHTQTATQAPRVITPHPGEAARLLDCAVAEIEADRFAAVRRLQHDGRTVLLKGPNTLIASPRRPISVNVTGHQVLATAGSGDVLAGVVGALLARGSSPHDAAQLAAHVHGLAGEQLAARAPEGWTATDIAAQLPHAIAKLLAI